MTERLARRETKNIVKDLDFSVAMWAGADADGGDRKRLGDTAREFGWDQLQNDGEGARSLNTLGCVKDHLPCFSFALYPEAAEDMVALGGHTDVADNGDTGARELFDSLFPGAFELYGIGSRLDQRDAIGNRLFGARLEGAKRHIGGEERSPAASSGGGYVMEHLLHGNREGVLIAEGDVANGITNEDEVNSRLVGYGGGWGVIGSDADDSAALHGADSWCGDADFHGQEGYPLGPRLACPTRVGQRSLVGDLVCEGTTNHGVDDFVSAGVVFASLDALADLFDQLLANLGHGKDRLFDFVEKFEVSVAGAMEIDLVVGKLAAFSALFDERFYLFGCDSHSGFLDRLPSSSTGGPAGLTALWLCAPPPGDCLFLVEAVWLLHGIVGTVPHIFRVAWSDFLIRVAGAEHLMRGILRLPRARVVELVDTLP